MNRTSVQTLVAFTFVLMLAPLAALHGANKAEWEQEFAGFPPAEARPLVWWHWINGNITKEGIRADLEDMKRVGIAGAQMLDVSIYLPPGPVRYGSDSWHEHVQFAIRTAAELGLELDLMNSPGWSGAGGPWITPERGMKRYVWTETEVAGGSVVNLKLPRPTAKLDFYRDVAVLAFPTGSKATVKEEPTLKSVAAVKLDPQATPIATERVCVLTKSMNTEGLLTAELPAGRWTILRFGYTTTGSMNHPAQPEGHGQECDKLDEEIVKFQFEQSLGRIIREAGPLVGKGLRGVLFDSFEGGFQNWSAALPREFQQRKGYDLVPWLPVLTGRAVGSAEQSEAFLRDFRKVIAELVAEKYFGTMQRLAHAHGLQVYAEAQGGPLNPFLCNAHTDVPMNEFWMPDARPRFGNMKQIASVANLLGRRVVGAEAFTAKPEDGRWLATPATLKACGDVAFAAGINRFIFHTYVHQPYSDIAPGFTLGRYGTHFGRLNTWWPMANAWMRYLARCQFLLQQGHTAADVLLLTDPEAGYFSSDRKAFKVPSGYDFDLCYPHHLAAMVWRDGAFRLPPGPAYRLLVLPKQWFADLATLQRLKSFLAQGAAIVGLPPTAPAGLLKQRDHLAEWRTLVGEVFAHVKPCRSLQAALDAIELPPDAAFAARGGESEVYWLHRTTGERDLYFVSNQSGKPLQLTADFRAGRRAPEIWDPVTGKITPALDFKAEAGHVSLPLALDVAASTFVVFRHTLPADAPVAAPPVAEFAPPIAIAGPWRVRFQSGRAAPAEITLDQLSSWTKQPDSGVTYFSGIATYTTRFTAPAPIAQMRRVLQLGKVCDIAAVKVNDRSAGIAWTAPFELDVTDLVRPGENTLEIAVANRWVNRLVGDEALPPDARYEVTGSKFTSGRLAELPPWLGNAELTRRRQRITFATWHFYDTNSPLLESGLLGPVTLLSTWTKPALDEAPPSAFLQLPAHHVEQSGKLPEGVVGAKVLANEPDGGTCSLILEFDLEATAQSATPLARLQIAALEKLKVKRPGQKPGGGRGALHVLAQSELVGSACVKPAGIATPYTIDVTAVVSQTLARPAGQRKLRLDLRMTGQPTYYEVYGLVNGPPMLEIAPLAKWTQDWEQRLTPITRGPVVYREACMPITTDRKADLTLPLLHPARKIVDVIANATGEKLQEGRDWLLRDGKLVLPAGTRAPVQLEAEFFTARLKSKTGEVQPHRTSIRLAEGTWYHQRQIEVTYEPAARDWSLPPPISSLDQLPRLKRLLAQKVPLKVVLFGDSISLGGNASKFQGCWPYQPNFGELVAWKIQQHYGNKITFMNHSRGGAGAAFGASQAESQVGWFKPDLAIIGYGMNDRSEERRKTYRENLEKIIDTIRRDSPATEFIVVTAMLNNPKQPSGLDPVLFLRDEALKITRPGLAFVDMTGTHQTLLKRKNYLDTSGNGANHPNDYLHRIYAQRLLEVLIPAQTP